MPTRTRTRTRKPKQDAVFYIEENGEVFEIDAYGRRRYIDPDKDGVDFSDPWNLPHGVRRPRRRVFAETEPVEPPKPKLSEEQIRLFHTPGVEKQDQHWGIYLNSIDEVKAAIVTMSRGYSQSFGTTLDTVSDANGPMAAAIMMMGQCMINDNDFLTGVLRDVERYLTHGNARDEKAYSERWDYHVPSAFHKLSLQVGQYKDGWILHIYAAYVGNKNEPALAQKLNRPVGLMRIDVTKSYACDEDGYARIPMADFVRMAGGDEAAARAFVEVLCEEEKPFAEERVRRVLRETESVSILGEFVNYTVLSRHCDEVRSGGKRNHVPQIVGDHLVVAGRLSHVEPIYGVVKVTMSVNPVGDLCPTFDDGHKAIMTAEADAIVAALTA